TNLVWKWRTPNKTQQDKVVDCQRDSGVHGSLTNPTPKVYVRKGSDKPTLYSNNVLREVAWGSSPTHTVITVFDSNYLNWYYGPTSTSTRLQVVKDVATSLLGSINGVNVGLMRFNYREGGPVVYAMENIATARAGMIDAINALPASGWTPLSETLYEAGQYYAGRNVDYGDDNGGDYGSLLSVDSSRVSPGSNTYKSPIQYSCAKNYIVLLTDGVDKGSSLARDDALAAARTQGVPIFTIGLGLGQLVFNRHVEGYRLFPPVLGQLGQRVPGQCQWSVARVPYLVVRVVQNLLLPHAMPLRCL
ncbi:MAG: hypothetical protein IIA27_15675, partial [Gemmatimonadetes bacterium]|nr:hypothetical protein [Gemmatimonadota bacterium]